MIVDYKNYAASEIKNDFFVSIIGFVGNLVNAVARMVWTTLLDRYRYKPLFIASIAMQL
jgi:hypothetical protein